VYAPCIDLAETIAETPQLDWMLLTNRIEKFNRPAPWSLLDVPQNVWIGTTSKAIGDGFTSQGSTRASVS